jgi:hypothetical protein
MSEGGRPNRIETFPYDVAGTARRRQRVFRFDPLLTMEVRRGSIHTGSGLAVLVCVSAVAASCRLLRWPTTRGAAASARRQEPVGDVGDAVAEAHGRDRS